ncbi:MAG: aminotransferase class I/II-fold pyridoxal phosphate-dependent enzyme [Acidobacteriota bacterium]
MTQSAPPSNRSSAPEPRKTELFDAQRPAEDAADVVAFPGSDELSAEQGEILQQLRALVKDFYAAAPAQEFIPGESPVRLMLPSFDHREVTQAMESLLSTYITLNQSSGNKIAAFEAGWSQYIGSSNGVMVNSGSSANLLALFMLRNPKIPGHLKPGDEIITPAVTWHTTVSPIIAAGCVPVLADVNLPRYTMDVEQVEKLITPRTRALFPVHLLGNACDMDGLMALAERYGLWVIEDTCEAHGAEFRGHRAGSIGHIGTFSFFFSHHLTTMEGGMVVTDDDQLAELARIMRSQGVIRNTRRREELAAHYRQQPEVADFDPGFLFANLGFNLRPTELNGGFGLEQLKKFPQFLETRRVNGRYWAQRMAGYGDLFHLPDPEDHEGAWFSFPLTLRAGAPFSREEIVNHLRGCGIETRPVMAGNVALQPAMQLFHHRSGDLPVAEHIHRHGFFWGNHQGICEAQRSYVADCVDDFIASHGARSSTSVSGADLARGDASAASSEESEDSQRAAG